MLDHLDFGPALEQPAWDLVLELVQISDCDHVKHILDFGQPADTTNEVVQVLCCIRFMFYIPENNSSENTFSHVFIKNKQLEQVNYIMQSRMGSAVLWTLS